MGTTTQCICRVLLCCTALQNSVRKKGMFFEVSIDLLYVKVMSLAMKAEMKVYLDLWHMGNLI